MHIKKHQDKPGIKLTGDTKSLNADMDEYANKYWI